MAGSRLAQEFDIEGVTITSASQASMDDLCSAMNKAFSDYQIPMHLSPEAFAAMMRQRGLDRNASSIALVDDQIAAFWLMSVRGAAAYLISSGTLPEFRGKGLSTRIAHHVLEKLHAAQVATFQTEVLENNQSAQRLYARIGMTRHRDLGCVTVSPAPALSDPGLEIAERPWADLQGHVAAMRDWPPSWQHSDASLIALGEGVASFCAIQGDRVVGVVALIKGTNTVAQIAVDEGARRQGIGSALLRAAAGAATGTPLRVINFAAADKGFEAFLKTHHAEKMIGQFELVQQL